MIVSTSAQMREADARAIAGGIPSIRLMETASRAVADAAELFLKPEEGALVFCGSGNNGGDGIGAAVELLSDGYPARVFLTGSRAHMTPDALEMERRLREKGGVLEEYDPAVPLPEAAVAIDAIFGIGLNKAVQGKALAAIEAINASGLPVVAADVASGVEADTGRILGAAVRAAVTVTFSMAKPGHFAEPGCVCCGRLEIADIGIPADILEQCGAGVYAVTDANAALPRRNPLSHKGDYGKLLILGGSAGYTGAPTLCARAAVRAGAGLVYLGVPAPIYTITAVKNDEAMPFSLPAGADGKLTSPLAVDQALERAEACDVTAVGPGLGRSENMGHLIEALLTAECCESKPLVIDADGLNALAGHLEWLRDRTVPAVLTPHEGEFTRLGGSLEEGRLRGAARFAEENRCVMVLKGHRTIAAFPDGTLYVATRGNPGMAKGGSGDVLTGILAAMLGQFSNLKQAVCTGIQLHALAGDLCRDRLGEYAMTASDVIETLPAASRYLANLS